MLTVYIKINEKKFLNIKIKNTAKTTEKGTIYQYQVIDKKNLGGCYGNILHKTKDGALSLIKKVIEDIENNIVGNINEH